MHYETDTLRTLALRTMKARATGNLAAAYSPAATEQFFDLVDQIDANLDRVRINEQALLNDRLRAAQHSQSHYVRLMLAGSLGSLLVVVVSSLFMLRLEQRKEQVESQLRETRERLDLASRGAFDGIWDWNLRTDEIYFSPRLKEILGYRDNELANSLATVRERMHPDDIDRQQELNRRYLDREVPRYEDVFRLRHRDGSWRWVMSRGIAVWDERGRPVRMVGVHTDITSLKRLEEDLRDAKATADAANRAKTNFLANMSHEIRTPMNAIIGIAGILSRKTPVDSRDREYIEALDIASRSLFSLINDLLDLSKLGEGSLTLEQVPFDLRQLLEEALTMARVRAEEKKIALVSDLSFELPAAFVGDPTRVRQVVSNLLSNAVKFTEKGSVILRADVTPVGHLEIRVRDTGIGIPKDMQPHIFEKFTQSDPSITRRFGGTGLGLTISKELAELMGGEIDLVSEEGVGSEFIVTLPLPAARPQAEAPAAPAEAPRTRSKGTVLLVEDYKPNILVVRTILGGLGFACDAVSTGAEAAAILCGADHGRYSIVLMDVQLPDLSGVAVTQRVRECEAANGWPHLPIVAVTAHALLGDREKFLQSGMDAYIAKPFDPEDLAEKITALVARYRRKPAAAKANAPAPAPHKRPAQFTLSRRAGEGCAGLASRRRA